FITFAGPPAAGVIDNIGDGHTEGFEAELFVRPNDYLTFFAGGNYVKSTIDDIQTGSDGLNLFLTGTVPGQPLPFIPETTFTLGAEGYYPIGTSGYEFFGRTSYAYTGEYTTFADGTPGSDLNPYLGDYGIWDLGVGVRNDRVSFDLRVSNMLNERAINQASPTTAVIVGALGGFSYLPADAPANAFDDFQITRPRTITFTARVEF
ncbi:MAG: hypothetical protein MIO92_06315, partial [Methanosarcinaceae archaeon]|nr:hypothetical protein [Methanosarcinaceae archaeon]